MKEISKIDSMSNSSFLFVDLKHKNFNVYGSNVDQHKTAQSP